MVAAESRFLQKYDWALNYIKRFLMLKIGEQIINKWFREFNTGLQFVQKKIKTRLAVKYGKVDVLKNQWVKLLNTIMQIASKPKDKPMIDICKQILAVSPEI